MMCFQVTWIDTGILAMVNDLEELGGNSARKPRLLFVSNLFPDSISTYRGLDNATLLHHLREFYDVKVICPRPSLRLKTWFGASASRLLPRDIDKVLDPFFVEVPYVPFFGTPFNHWLMRMFLRRPLSRIIKLDGINAVLCSWLYPDGCAVTPIAKELDVPVVLITQGTDTHHYIHYPLRKRFIIRAIDQSRAVITRSIDLARLLEVAGAQSSKMHAVHNGVDTSIFHPRDKILSRRALGLPEDGKVIVFVGNFLPVKNPEFLLEAFSSIRAKDRVILGMIGKGPLREKLVDLSFELGVSDRVLFTGPLDADGVAEWMGAADALCLCSHNEGLPNVVIEALATGVRVVSSRVGGIGELLNSECSGVLVEPGDIKGYVNALEEVIDSVGSRDAAPRIQTELSWAECARKYANIIDPLINDE